MIDRHREGAALRQQTKRCDPIAHYPPPPLRIGRQSAGQVRTESNACQIEKGIPVYVPKVEAARATCDHDPRSRCRVDRQFQSAREVVGSAQWRSEEHTSELQSLMRISYAVFCLKKKKQIYTTPTK